jgi:pimeloyl-ACP methyl ester carboxylesterase
MRPSTRRSAVCAGVALALLLTAPGACAEVVDAGAAGHLLILTPVGPPRAAVLLIPGGDTRQHIGADGAPTGKESNFLVRSRQLFVDRGFVVGLVENPDELGAAIATLAQRATPVILVGTSRGTIPAIANAVRYPATVGGVVLTSTVDDALRQPLERITAPVFVVHAQDDGCRASPPWVARDLGKRLPQATVVVLTTHSALVSAPCDALSPHGYLGIEPAIVDRIATWIDALPARADGASSAPPRSRADRAGGARR